MHQHDPYHWMELTFKERGDEQLLADWEEAKRRAEAENDTWIKMEFCDRYRSGEYWRERREKTHPRPKPRVIAPKNPHDFTIGRALAAERVRARMRQDQLATATGITRETISKVERNRRPLLFDEGCRIADALEISLEHLRAR
jgi:DNA-binding XRE family transcriptional regulator